MRTPLVVGNWKMHGGLAEARALAQSVRDGLKRPRGVEVVVCPPFTALAAVGEVLGGSAVGLGAQNCHWEPYGPVWAIGTGVNATPAQAAEVHGYLRGLASELGSKDLAQTVRVLYGGSVKADNAAEVTQEPDVDGVLVGGASLQAQSFIAIAK